tara:strand:- start:11763 stop:12353 length:591 start_codon:yes stop_codon:yes gene_type:complete
MKDLTKNKILDVAENHFSKNGYYKTPLDEIVKKSKISKGGIYFHFPSKEDLFLSVMDRLAKKLLSKIEKGNLSIDNPNERLVSSLKNLLNILSSQKKLAKLLITQTNNIKSFEKKRSEIFNKFSNVIEININESIKINQYPKVNANLVSKMWIGTFNEIVFNWIFSNGNPPRDYFEELKIILITLPSKNSIEYKNE